MIMAYSSCNIEGERHSINLDFFGDHLVLEIERKRLDGGLVYSNCVQIDRKDFLEWLLKGQKEKSLNALVMRGYDSVKRKG